VSAVYTHAKEAILRGQIDLIRDSVRVLAVETNDGIYEPDAVRDAFLSDVPVEARKATSDELTGKSIAAGVFRSNDTEYTVDSGERVDALVLYVERSDDDTSPLLCLLDEGRGYPLWGNGLPVDCQWPDEEIIRFFT
jgi:hypothetical protein